MKIMRNLASSSMARALIGGVLEGFHASSAHALMIKLAWRQASSSVIETIARGKIASLTIFLLITNRLLRVFYVAIAQLHILRPISGAHFCIFG